MKLLVFSDSHGQTAPMLAAVRREKPELLMHLGDYTGDADALAEKFPRLPLYRVRGNCDFFETQTPERALVQCAGVKIFAVHGHRYGVKSDLTRLLFAAREKEAALVLFGHTHCPYCEEVNGVWLLNPGACGGRTPTYGAVELQNGAALCRVETIREEPI